MRGDLAEGHRDEVAEDARRWGLSHVPGRHATQADGLWPDHIEAMQAFLAVAGQWRCVAFPNGALLWSGLDYAAAAAAFALSGLNPSPSVWEQVRQIESGAIEELNRVR